MITKNGKLHMVKHPYISSIYLEKSKNKSEAKARDTLVIETDIDLSKSGFNAGDERLIELLMDLNELQMIAEQRIGKFDHVDIRSNPHL